jgi:DNA-binding PadR family transcriptional regulator
LTQEQNDEESQVTTVPSKFEIHQPSPHTNKVADLLDILLLSRLWMEPMGGYQLRMNLAREFGFRVSFGTLYPHLKNLERSKLIIQESRAADRPKKTVYRLSPLGKSTLKLNAIAIIKIASTLRPIVDSR